MNVNLLIDGAGEFGIKIEPVQIELLSKYKDLVLEWNEKINLTAITNDDDFIIKHFLDSFSLLTLENFDGKKKLIDVGTGAGFPGIPLKILRPDLDVLLLDSLNKRVKFLNEAIERLGLTGITAIHSRAEEAARNVLYKEKFDICVSRAVANMTTLSKYCLPFVKSGGYFCAMKGRETTDELNFAKSAIITLGGSVDDVKEINLPFSDIKHTIIVVKKFVKHRQNVSEKSKALHKNKRK